MARKDPSHEETARGWDIVARAKYRSEFEEHVAFLQSGSHNLLDPEFEVIHELLRGSHVVHLQCSHGLDALGLLNAGAESVLGIDISGEMVSQARAKARALGMRTARFLACDVTDLPDDTAETADLVYTGRGSLPWILNLAGWAGSVSMLLKPGGHVFIFEGHPLTSLWDRESDRPELRRGVGYFDDRVAEEPGFPAAIVERESGADRPQMLERYWRPGEVMEALLDGGLEVRLFREYPDLFWDQFPNWPVELRGTLPNSYAILAQKPRAVYGGST